MLQHVTDESKFRNEAIAVFSNRSQLGILLALGLHEDVFRLICGLQNGM